MEHAGLRARIGRTAGPGRRLRRARGRPFLAADPTAAGRVVAWRSGAEIRRPGRFFRLAGAAEIQDARPRFPQPLAEQPALPGVRRIAAAARGPGRADRRRNIAEIARHAGRRGRRVLPPAWNCRDVGTPRRPRHARTGAITAGLPGGGRTGLPCAGPHAPHAQRRRGPAGRLDYRARAPAS